VQVIYLDPSSHWLGGPYRGEPLRVLAASALAYGFVYIHGIAAVTVFAANLRAIAEHQIGGDHAAHTGLAALRNFSCNPMTRIFFGAYGSRTMPRIIDFRPFPITRWPTRPRPWRQGSGHGQGSWLCSTIISLARQKAPSPSLLDQERTA